MSDPPASAPVPPATSTSTASTPPVRSSSRGSSDSGTASPVSHRQPRNRKPKADGTGGRRGSGTNQPKSEGLANLRSLISEIKDAPATGPTTASSSSRARTAKGGAGPVQGLPVSSLNPAARGFTANAGLAPISDLRNEALITPTASSFDLMTGAPFLGPGGHSFAFPPSANAIQLAQQQQQQLLLLQQQQQQQQFQLQQLQAQNLSYVQEQQYAAAQMRAPTPPRFGGPSQGGTNDLLAEQYAIQQQFEQLRLQQESLLARFTDMQVAENAAPRLAQQQGNPAQRRMPPQQQQGPMGSFGQGGMGNFGINGGFGGMSGPATSNLPRGHASRQSTGVRPVPSPSPPPPASAMNQTAVGSGAMSGGFQFPRNGPAPPAAAAGGNGYERYQRDEANAGRQYGHARKESQLGSISGGGWSVPPSSFPATSAQLIEASHHLEELALYRASSGHSRVPSFGMSAAAVSSGMAGYGGGAPNAGGPQGRKNLFGPYLPQNSIAPLVRAGKLVIGTLRVNKKNRSDAYVSTETSDADIYICGSKDRNRALEGDVVAIELLNVDEVWGTKKDKEEKKRKKEEHSSSDLRATRDLRKLDKKKDDVEVEGQGLLLLEEEEVTDEQKPKYAGHVVAVVERAPGQFFSGLLGVLRPSSAATQQKQDHERRERDGGDSRGGGNNFHQAPKIIWFRPTDKRVPLMAIPTEQAPHDFIANPDKYSNTLFVSCIKRWPISSLHPFGILVETLGPIGDIETETAALLKDCNFSSDEFSEAVVKCLPQLPYTIPEREYSPEVRRDYREHTVFTIDPETARDLDDALHVVKNEDGTFEVGVHIADVTHFVKPGTALDREARLRATTVYLVQKAVPMLPQLLSETLCSLTPGKDKLTFSVVFNLNADGTIISTWFGKTVINSAVKLAYADAQTVIDAGHIAEAKIEKKVTRDAVEGDILLLAGLARQIRARRFDCGSLRIDGVKVSFGLDANGVPNDCSSFERKEANELIEEFMLMANIAVAGKIAAGLPDQALLRRHEPPVEKRINSFITRMGRLGIVLDPSSAGTMMDSIESIDDQTSRLTLSHLATRAMQRAKYFCSGTLDIAFFQHYALNVPLYTHFTSPIRRYADVLVHRQLEAILTGSAELKNSMDTETVSRVAAICNVKKDAARLASEQSAHLFLCVLISDLTSRYGPVIRPATVIGVLDAAFDVIVPEFGIEKRVHVDQMPIQSHVYNAEDNSLQVFWKKDVDVLRWLSEQNNDEHLRRVRASADDHRARQIANTADASAGDAPADDKTAPRRESSQHAKSQSKISPVFQEIQSTPGGDHIQTIRELQSVPVVVTADMTKSPPVIKVVSLNPFV